MIVSIMAGLALQTMPYAEACTEGVWESWSETRTASGEMAGNHDRSNRYCFHDGRAELAEYRSLGPDNQPVFHGVSLTVWNEDRSAGRTLWAMVGDAGYTDIGQAWQDGELATHGDGFDASGAFSERARYRFAPGGDFRFEMDRSFDGGESWTAPTNIIHALRTSQPPAPLDNDWHPQIAGFAAARTGENGTIILDGLAWFDWIEGPDGAPVGARFASPVRVEDEWVWQTLTWTADGVETDRIPLN